MRLLAALLLVAGCGSGNPRPDGASGDLATVDDLATRDLAMPAPDDLARPDLRPSRDLAPPPDLAPPRDLAPPADLAPPVDLAPALDFTALPDLVPPPDLVPGVPLLWWSPGSASYGAWPVGVAAPAEVVTLVNRGTGALHIQSVTLGGANQADFPLDLHTLVTTLGPSGGATTFTITFKPIATGARSALAVVTSDDVMNPQVLIELNGSGKLVPDGG